MKIAVDAMGGDFAPEAIVEGAVQAAEEYGFSIILTGQEDRVRVELAKYPTDHLSIEVRHAPQVVEMDDIPSYALRRKKDSSLHLAINLAKSGEADAAVSAGNTGAAMAIGKLACRMLDGIERPALATVLPNIHGVTVIIDVGANVDCKPLHLLQFPVMGHVYARDVFGIETPRIGLISTGEEDTKGNALTKETFQALNESPLNFIGNAEGRDVFNGRMDVIVTDGFTGNVVLKVSESLAKTMGRLLKDAFSQNWRTKLGYLLVKPGIDAMQKRVDYSEYGGAPLLGLNGVVIVSHGSSKARAMKNAIRVAAESVNHHLNEQIIEALKLCEFDTKSWSKASSLWRQITRSIRHESSSKDKPAEKKAEAEQPTAVAPEESAGNIPEAAVPHDVEHEYEKKHWWSSLKRGELQKEEPVSEENLPVQETVAQDEPEKLEEISADVILPDVPTDEKESDDDRRHWWTFRHRSDLGTEEATPEDELQPQEQAVDDEPHVQDKEISLVHDPLLQDAPSSKKSWWKKRKEPSAPKTETSVAEEQPPAANQKEPIEIESDDQP